MEWDKLWTINKKIIDPVCPRHTAVIEERRVLLTLTDGPEKPFVRIIPRHKKFDGAGQKATTYTKRIWLDYADAMLIAVDEEVTLMDWGNAIIKGIEKDQDGKVTQLTGVLHLEGSVKTTKLKLTWLPETDELVNLSLVEFDYLITKKKVCTCVSSSTSKIFICCLLSIGVFDTNCICSSKKERIFLTSSTRVLKRRRQRSGTRTCET